MHPEKVALVLSRRLTAVGATHFIIMTQQSATEMVQAFPALSYTTASATMIGSTAYGSATTTHTPPIMMGQTSYAYTVLVLYVPKQARSRLPAELRPVDSEGTGY